MLTLWNPTRRVQEEIWVLEFGMAGFDRTADPIIRGKLEQAKPYCAQFASLPVKIAAIMVDRDKKVHARWRSRSGAGQPWMLDDGTAEEAAATGSGGKGKGTAGSL